MDRVSEIGRAPRRPGASRAFLTSLALASLCLSFLVAGCAKKGPASTELVAYTYDSFVSEWGPGPIIGPAFEKESGIKIRLVSKGDAGQVLAALVAEKKKPIADIVIGLDQNYLPQAIKSGILTPYLSRNIEAVPDELRLGTENLLTPYDYGVFAIIWDSQSKIKPPESLADLTKPEYAKKLILMDPRSSSPGLGFLSWTLSAYGDDWAKYWKSLMPSVLTVASGWDSGYGLFLQGEAPLVLSYTTSPAYHLYAEKTERYKTLVFAQGHPLQIEGSGIVKGTKRRAAAQKFIDFTLTPAFQDKLALTNWMYPVVQGIPLPDCYRAAPEPAIAQAPDQAALAAALGSWASEASR
jgi:thiamine transport system substrate-binding protein